MLLQSGMPKRSAVGGLLLPALSLLLLWGPELASGFLHPCGVQRFRQVRQGTLPPHFLNHLIEEGGRKYLTGRLFSLKQGTRTLPVKMASPTASSLKKDNPQEVEGDFLPPKRKPTRLVVDLPKEGLWVLEQVRAAKGVGV
jgi:hypothetical protein